MVNKKVIIFSAGAFYDQSYWQDYRIAVYSSGYIEWTYGGVFSTTCSLNIEYYPFDKQVGACEVSIASCYDKLRYAADLNTYVGSKQKYVVFFGNMSKHFYFSNNDLFVIIQ